MEPGCKEEALTLKNLLTIALGKTESFTATNVAILYSVVKSILKKLNCEDEVVTIYGVKSRELQELLCKANRCPLPCDEQLKVLTAKLNNLEALEQKIETMESKLSIHLEKKFTKTVYEEPEQEEEFSRQSQDFMSKLKLSKVASQEPLTHRPVSSFNISFNEGTNDAKDLKMRHRSLVFESIKATPSRYAFSPAPSSAATDGEVSSISESADCLAKQAKELKESFSAFKRRVEDNEGWWEYTPAICEEASVVISTKPSVTDQAEVKVEVEEKVEEEAAETPSSKSSVATKDAYCCFVPCEDNFTIPSPENEIPRALLKSTFFMQNLRELLKAPFMRRMKKIEQNFETLVTNLLNWIMEVKERSSASTIAYENCLSQLAEVSYNITGNHFVLQDTLAGMQEIFDLKYDKYEIIKVKQQLCDLLNRAAQETAKLKQQLTQSKTAGFVFQTEQEKRKSALSQKSVLKFLKCSSCIAYACDSNVRCESQLLRRIEQFTSFDLSQLKERQQISHRPIRLTNNSIILKEVTKQMPNIYKYGNKSQDASSRT